MKQTFQIHLIRIIKMKINAVHPTEWKDGRTIFTQTATCKDPTAIKIMSY